MARSDQICRTHDELKEAIRKALEQTDESTRSIALATGITHGHISHFKNGIRPNLAFERLEVLAGHLGVRYCLKNY